MATFQAQIEATTGIAASDGSSAAPKTSEYSTWLTEGARDLIMKLSRVAPPKLLLFTSSLTVSDGNGLSTDNGLILTAMRADGENADRLYPCERMSAELRYKVTDKESLDYRSVYHPIFYTLDGKTYILPAPSNSTTNRGVITQVQYPTILFGDSSIGVSHKEVTGATGEADNETFTKNPHTFANGELVEVLDVVGDTSVEGVRGTITSANIGANTFKIDNVVIDGDISSCTVRTVSSGFPKEFEQAVVQYATVKVFEALMGYYSTTEEDAELVNTIQSSLVTAESRYQAAFQAVAGTGPEQERSEEDEE